MHPNFTPNVRQAVIIAILNSCLQSFALLVKHHLLLSLQQNQITISASVTSLASFCSRRLLILLTRVINTAQDTLGLAGSHFPSKSNIIASGSKREIMLFKMMVDAVANSNAMLEEAKMCER